MMQQEVTTRDSRVMRSMLARNAKYHYYLKSIK
jgi:hypothetical protein